MTHFATELMDNYSPDRTKEPANGQAEDGQLTGTLNLHASADHSFPVV